MKMKTLLALISMTIANSSIARTYNIVLEKKAVSTIIFAKKDADASGAAAEISLFIEKMSGVKLPLIEEGQPIKDKHGISIYVGHTDAAKKLGIKIPSGFDPSIRADMYNKEQYIIKTTKYGIFIGGNGDGPYHGTYYAAYALLNKLGCRWYFPGKWGEVIPKKKTITLPELNISTKPDFPMRIIWLNGRWRVSAIDRKVYRKWCMRVGLSDDHVGKMYPLPADGSLAQILPPKEYAKSNPEFYAMNEAGVRNISLKSNPYHTMLCLTNKKMIAEYIKNLKEVFEGKRKVMWLSDIGIGISPPDGVPYCYSDACKAESQGFKYPRYTHRTMQSEEVFGFANKLATAFPNKLISVAAYSLRDIPPQGVKLLSNVAVMQAPISNCAIHPNNSPTCWRRQEFLKYLKRWTKLSQHVWIYDYTPGMLVSQFQPERDVANFAINSKIYKEIGIKGFSREGSITMMSTWIGYYVSAKLMWDVNTDVESLKKDFYTTFFGSEAGPHIQAWWDACESKLLESKVHVHEAWLVNHLYTAKFAQSIHKYVEAAKQSKMTPKQRKRFTAFELITKNFEASTEMDEAVKNLNYKQAVICANRMLFVRNKINKISHFLIGKGAQTSKWRMWTLGRKLYYTKLDNKINGKTGELVAPLPLLTAFKRDPYNVGITSEWYKADLNDKGWETKNTFFTWDAQDKPEDSTGHDYDGYGWYRASITIPKKFKGKSIYFLGEAINEAWIWINGEYVGHKSYTIWWMGKNDFELDISKFIHPGKNTIAIRVWNDAEIGGLLNRGFLWSPKAQ